MGNGLLLIIVIIIIISAVVGAIAQFLNRLGEMNAPNRREAGPGAGAARRADTGAGARQADRDMDRFLAEIDRLRRKNAEGAAEPPRAAAPAVPVARPSNRPAERPRPRVAELAEAQRATADAQGFTAPPAAPPSPIVPATGYGTSPPEALPVATVVVPPAATTGAPVATRVTKIAQRARPQPKTPLARNLTGLLGSGQGVALAVILQEVLGPPRCRKG
jgi:hypothetical protein